MLLCCVVFPASELWIIIFSNRGFGRDFSSCCCSCRFWSNSLRSLHPGRRSEFVGRVQVESFNYANIILEQVGRDRRIIISYSSRCLLAAIPPPGWFRCVSWYWKRNLDLTSEVTVFALICLPCWIPRPSVVECGTIKEKNGRGDTSALNHYRPTVHPLPPHPFQQIHSMARVVTK